MLKAGLSLSDLREMCADEIELWLEALHARDELDFQARLNEGNLSRRFDNELHRARRMARIQSDYTWHDKLRLPVDLRKRKW